MLKLQKLSSTKYPVLDLFNGDEIGPFMVELQQLVESCLAGVDLGNKQKAILTANLDRGSLRVLDFGELFGERQRADIRRLSNEIFVAVGDILKLREEDTDYALNWEYFPEGSVPIDDGADVDLYHVDWNRKYFGSWGGVIATQYVEGELVFTESDLVGFSGKNFGNFLAHHSHLVDDVARKAVSAGTVDVGEFDNGILHSVGEYSCVHQRGLPKKAGVRGSLDIDMMIEW